MSDAQSLIVRTASMADFDAVDALFARSYPALLAADYAPSVMVTAVPLISKAQPGLLRSGSFFLAENRYGIVGAGGWTQEAPGGGAGQRGVGHVRHVVTDHTRVRQGIGGALMRHVMMHAKASGMAQLHCQSTLTAVPFYTAMGFAVRGDITVALPGGIGFPAVFMVAQL
ncbi:GNAT family N-acetyltransferase [Thalassococcus sp. BH17M4-6]|uniref:GNAT family N-acetyltransferase n=1 Tax=Thalassococcus sp. BH17M4-6 TaxID=3413148 RepID=UPI003BEAABD9